MGGDGTHAEQERVLRDTADLCEKTSRNVLITAIQMGAVFEWSYSTAVVDPIQGGRA